MHFDGKSAFEITGNELLGLIGAPEDEWLDFKQQGYLGDSTKGAELAKDVTAMANAGGGFIVIGVSEKNETAIGFFNVDRADAEVDHIRDQCLQRIEPRLVGLEIVPKTVPTAGSPTVLIIHVPHGETPPYGFKWDDRTVFVRRYGAHIRHYPVADLADGFAARKAPAWVSALTSSLRSPVRPVDIDSSALEQSDPDALIDVMTERFVRDVQEAPFYRILVLPKLPRTDAIDTDAPPVRAILQAPPHVRPHGFGFEGVRTVRPSAEGLVATDGENTLLLLKNGYMELRYPLDGHRFQWRASQSGFTGKWLYPYAVVEMPVSFLRTAKDIYSAARLGGKFLVRQEYWNLGGFTLFGGHPGERLFGVGDKRSPRQFSQTSLKSPPKTLITNFPPDQTALELVVGVYNAFGFERAVVPLFDESGAFELDD